MTETRAERIEELFAEGVDLPPAERDSFLESRCGTDHELRAEVEALLVTDDSQPIGFLETPAIATDALPPGTMIAGKYKSLQLLGEGGMGMVYLAEQQRPVRRRVAIKVLKLGMDTRQVIARFEAERQALAMMDHPAIARVLDAGATDAGRPFFAMELVRGVPITRYCDDQRLTTRARIELFLPVIDAIQHAHHKGVIHRDVKPGNIIVTLDSGRAVAKVIDFGVAKAINHQLTEKTLFTAHGQLVGTPEYMSPEQAGMSELDIDTRTDVYSLGAVLYELLTGSKPFRSSSAGFLEIQRRIREVEPVRPSTRVTRAEPAESEPEDEKADPSPTSIARIARLRGTDPESLSRELKRDLDWIIACAMAKDRTRRYETAAALGADLRRFLENQAVEARPPSATYRIAKFTSRNKGGVLGALAVLIVLIAGIIATSTLAISESRQREVALAALVAEKQATDRATRQEALATDAAIAAEQAAARAEAVNLFLEAMITSARTQSSRGRDVTMREVLDATTVRLNTGELADQPVVEEEVRDIIGRTYLDLGLPKKATDNLRWSYAHSIQTRGELAEESLAALDIYAEAVKEQVGQQTLAIELHERLYDLSARALGPDHPETLLALDGLANSILRDRRPAEAIPLHQTARKGLLEHFGPDDARAVLPLFNIGGCQRLLRDYDNAEKTYRQVVKAFDRTGWHISAIRARIELASGVLAPMGKEQEGIRLLEDAIELGQDLLGVDHAEILSGRLHLARIRWQQGDPEGRVAFKAVVEDRKRVFGEHSPEFAIALLDVGRMLMDQDGDSSQARPILEEALAVFLLETDAQRSAAACTGRLAVICLLQDSYKEAAEHALAFADLAASGWGDDHPNVTHARIRVGLALAGLGRLDQAEQILRAELENVRADVGDDHARTGFAMWALGRCLDLMEVDEEAEQLLVRGYDLHAAAASPANTELGLGRRYLREFFERRGRDAPRPADPPPP